MNVKYFVFLRVMIMVCLFSIISANFPSAEAHIVSRVDGIACCNGDLNYPMWDTGNHGGSAIDVSSAFIRKETKQYVYIEALDFTVNYDTDTMTQRSQNRLFRYDKKSGDVAFGDRETNKFQSLRWTDDLMKDAISLVRKRLNF